MERWSLRTLAGIGLVAFSATIAVAEVRIECADYDVVLSDEQAVTLRAEETGTEEELAQAVCNLFTDADTSNLPARVQVTMTSGIELDARLESSAN